MAVLMFIIGIAIDSTDVRRYASRMERLMQRGDYQAALEVGDESDKTDRHLMMLRIEALGHEHQLGDRLFSYPIQGKSADVKGLQGKQGDMTNLKGDYELCAYLVDKQLDKFAAALPHYYSLSDSQSGQRLRLPRYYREALVLYNHLRSNPQIIFHNTVMDTDFQDFRQLERQYSDPKARQVAVFRHYEGTYWYYYFYLNK